MAAANEQEAFRGRGRKGLVEGNALTIVWASAALLVVAKRCPYYRVGFCSFAFCRKAVPLLSCGLLQRCLLSKSGALTIVRASATLLVVEKWCPYFRAGFCNSACCRKVVPLLSCGLPQLCLLSKKRCPYYRAGFCKFTSCRLRRRFRASRGAVCRASYCRPYGG